MASTLHSVTIQPRDTLQIYDGRTLMFMGTNPTESPQTVSFHWGFFFITHVRITSIHKPEVAASGHVFWNGKSLIASRPKKIVPIKRRPGRPRKSAPDGRTLEFL